MSSHGMTDDDDDDDMQQHAHRVLELARRVIKIGDQISEAEALLASLRAEERVVHDQFEVVLKYKPTPKPV